MTSELHASLTCVLAAGVNRLHGRSYKSVAMQLRTGITLDTDKKLLLVYLFTILYILPLFQFIFSFLSLFLEYTLSTCSVVSVARAVSRRQRVCCASWLHRFLCLIHPCAACAVTTARPRGPETGRPHRRLCSRPAHLGVCRVCGDGAAFRPISRDAHLRASGSV